MPDRSRDKGREPFEIHIGASGAMTVRAATPGDVEGILALERAAFPDDWLSRRAVRRFVAAPHKPVMVARRADGLAGYALVSLRQGGRTCRIYSLAVDPLYGRRGVGRELVHACERYARAWGCEALRLETRYDNAPAIALYRGLGYQEFDRFEQYYADGGEALRLEKKLSNP
jgi:ribosomal protein S18 acetylase RimI-like enzyme